MDRVSAAEVAGAKPKRRRKAAVEKPVEPALPVPAQQEPPVVAQRPLEERLKDHFALFLILLWRHLLGVDPAPIMLDMARYLQFGGDKLGVEAFRGFSKSWITGAFCLWKLYCDPQEKVIVVSGSMAKAVELSNWCLTLLMTWDVVAHLQPTSTQRQSSKAFDVGPVVPTIAPSFKALGITGQLTGSRASLIIADDVETAENAITVTERERTAEAVKEFESVILPGGRIIYLGTPHSEDSLYNKLPSRGYEFRVWPALFPTPEEVKRYKGALAPYVLEQIEKHGPELVGTSTMPTRFTNDNLARRRVAIGKATFQLQYMLDTTLAGRDRFPLKLANLMVTSLDPRLGPERVAWTNDPEARCRDVPSMGFDGDWLHRAIVDKDCRRLPYNKVVGFLDISGRGADETSLSVIAELNGMLFLLTLWGDLGGYSPPTLERIAKDCVRLRMNLLLVEDNMGDGMFTALLRPVVQKAWEKHNSKLPRGEDHGGTTIEGVKASNKQSKEQRILSVLEPATEAHRLVVDAEVMRQDHKSVTEYEGEDTRHRYAFGYQFTHLTRDKDSLAHDDRLDSVAGAVGHFADILGVDPQQMASEASWDREEEELRKLFGDDLEEDEHGILREPRQKDDRPQGIGKQRR